MGGNIAWTVRRADGSELRMSRWTNIFPDIVSDEFLAGDDAAFDDAMKVWFEMKKDWVTNGPNGPYEHNMTPVYAPYPYGFRPDEYGFICVDFINNTVISCNHYTSFDHIFVSSTWWTRDRGYADRIQRYEKWFAEGRFTSFWLWYNNTNTYSKEPLPPAESFRQLVEIVGQHDNTFAQIDVKPPEGWTFKDISSETTAGRQQAYDEILALGFQLDDNEKTDWEHWISWPSRAGEDD